jgi:hypothetical protein
MRRGKTTREGSPPTLCHIGENKAAHDAQIPSLRGRKYSFCCRVNAYALSQRSPHVTLDFFVDLLQQPKPLSPKR